MAKAVVISSELITSAMTAQLAKVFRENAKAWNCYIEEQNQHFLRPAFFVKQVLMSQNKLMANNYERFYRMRIMWFPELNSNRKRNQCLAIGEKLLEAFLMLELENYPVRGSEFETEIIDEVLHFSVTYRLDAFIKHQYAKMKELDLDIVSTDYLKKG